MRSAAASYRSPLDPINRTWLNLDNLGCAGPDLDGQLYGIAYQLKNLPEGYNVNPFNYVSVLAWNLFAIPDQPTWHQHVRPILAQYANLYPVMSRRLIDLGNYDSVVANARIVRLSFSLPIDDPNSMPVTRDLSSNKRATILKWLDSKDPSTGLPPKGEAVSFGAPVGGPAEAVANEPDLGSKVGFLRQVLKTRQDNHAQD